MKKKLTAKILRKIHKGENVICRNGKQLQQAIKLFFKHSQGVCTDSWNPETSIYAIWEDENPQYCMECVVKVKKVIH